MNWVWGCDENVKMLQTTCLHLVTQLGWTKSQSENRESLGIGRWLILFAFSRIFRELIKHAFRVSVVA